MAKTWPATLPAPQWSGLTIKPTSDVKVRENQSGRKELRRFGSGAPDVITCTLRLIGEMQVEQFRYWYDRETNFGLNWIDADWLAMLGYADHYCRIQGYSEATSYGTFYTDFSLSLLVQQSIWDDTNWLEGPRDVEPIVIDPPGPPEGNVVVFGNQFSETTYPSSPPAGLRAVKAVILYSGQAAAALKADGTVVVWGSKPGSYPGWEMLSGIVDIVGASQSLMYLTNAGSIGVIGGNLDDSVPIITDGRMIVAWGGGTLYAQAVVVKQDGTWISWGDKTKEGFQSSILDVDHFSTGAMAIYAITKGGAVEILSTAPPSPAITGRPTSGVVCAGGNYRKGIAYLEDGTWYKWGNAYAPNPPSDLVPTYIKAYDNNLATTCAVALHTDGTPVIWGNATNVLSSFAANTPSDLKLWQMDYLCNSASVIYCVGIKKD